MTASVHVHCREHRERLYLAYNQRFGVWVYLKIYKALFMSYLRMRFANWAISLSPYLLLSK